MRLVLDRALFAAESQEEALALLQLFIAAGSDLQFQALLTDPPYLPGGENGPIDDWLNSRGVLEAHAFRQVLTTGPLIHAGRPVGGGSSDSLMPRRWHLTGPLTVRVERRLASDWKSRALTLADAVGLLREPVHLVLENSRTDKAFLTLLAGPTNGDTLRKLMDQPGRIEVHGGGGGEVKKWVEALAEDPPTPDIWRKLLRAWVLFDKDAGELDVCNLSVSASALMETCEDVVSIHGEWLSWVCLLRREIESYVPDSGLLEEATREQEGFVNRVISWRADSLRAPWAWALDFKKGLRGDLRADLPQDVRQRVTERKTPLDASMLKPPFEGLSFEELGALERGLGKNRLSDALCAKPA
ncbi:MAG TPA: hypothetical protein VEU33_13125, partial [Archangium sp.]|nr:hypothetical protein [Archangium sp.]